MSEQPENPQPVPSEHRRTKAPKLKGSAVLAQYHEISDAKERAEFFCAHRAELSQFLSGLNH